MSEGLEDVVAAETVLSQVDGANGSRQHKDRARHQAMEHPGHDDTKEGDAGHADGQVLAEMRQEIGGHYAGVKDYR